MRRHARTVRRSHIATGRIIDDLSLSRVTEILLPFYKDMIVFGSKKTEIRGRLRGGEPMFSEIYRYQIVK